jgi:hypothetical protein
MSKDKNIDTFINKFSQKINLLIQYEYNKNFINTSKHHLLFNDLLYTLFKRKQYAIDNECWTELYLRSLCFYKYKNKIGNIPLALVTKHNEILPFYFEQKIHNINNTFVHWDTHPDFNPVDQSIQLPKLYNTYLKTNNKDIINKAQNIVWDIGAASSGVFYATGIRDTIWNMPSWVPDKEISIDYFFTNSKKEVILNTESKDYKNMEEFFHNKHNDEVQKKYTKIQAGKLSKNGLKTMIDNISKNGNKYILDIDLDYFVCNGKPFNKKYWKNSFDLSSEHRTKLYDFNFYLPRGYDEYDDPSENKKLIKLEKDFKFEIKLINKRIKHFLNVLRYLKKNKYTPSHISVCDSTNVHFIGCQTCNSISNNYVPLNLALYVHTKVMIGLHKIF